MQPTAAQHTGLKRKKQKNKKKKPERKERKIKKDTNTSKHKGDVLSKTACNFIINAFPILRSVIQARQN